MNKKFCTILIMVLLTVSFFGQYYVVFADDTLDEWQQVTTNEELVEAFRAYCKSRDVTIDGSVADAVTKMTTTVFNNCCNTLGIDITALQAQIKYKVDQNQGLQWLFDTNGISAYNRIFAQFLQDNNLTVGDSADSENNELYNGHYYTYDHYTCLCFEGSLSDSWYNISNITSFGTSYYLDTNALLNMARGGQTSLTVPYSDVSVYTWPLTYSSANTSDSNTYEYGSFGSGSYGNVSFYYNGKRSGTAYDCYGFPIVIYRNGDYYANRIIINKLNNTFRIQLGYTQYKINLTNAQTGTTNIYITTNNTVINNNSYEGDTIINNNGTTDVPVQPPQPDPPINYNPYPDNPNYDPNTPGSGTTTDPINPADPDGGDNVDINFPDFDLDLPSINWSLGDFSSKFPFSIPFDIAYLVTTLNVEPEAPHLEGTIDFRITTWSFDLSLSQFDNIATIFRTLELIGFVIGLIIITRSIIRG